MAKYKLKYNYDTGNSFNTDYGLEEYLELEHNNLDIAKENLKRIELHYIQYKELNNISWSSKMTVEDILEKNKNEPWFVKEDKLCVYYMEGNKRKYQAIDKRMKAEQSAKKSNDKKAELKKLYYYAKLEKKNKENQK